MKNSTGGERNVREGFTAFRVHGIVVSSEVVAKLTEFCNRLKCIMKRRYGKN
jgi:hypothetical protein